MTYWFGSQPQLDLHWQFPLEKVGHFILFASLAFLCSIGRIGEKKLQLLLNLMLFAATTEILQFFVSYRTPTFRDWLIDVGGLICGLAFSQFLLIRGKHL